MDAEGRFKVQAETKGYAQLFATVVGHQALSLMLPTDGRPHEVSLRLAADAISVTKPEAVAVPGPRKLGARYPMAKGADGVWRARIQAEGVEFRYEVGGVAANGHTLNGTGAARYEYDGDSDYFSAVSVQDGFAEAAFDPKAFLAPGAPRASLAGEPGLDRYAAVMIQAQTLDDQMMLAFRAAAKTGVKPDLPSKDGALSGWKVALKTEKDPLARQALWLSLLRFGAKGEDLDFATLPKELSAGNPFFAAEPMFATFAPERMAQGPEREAYAAAIFRTLPEKPASSIAKEQLSELIYEGRATEAKAKLAKLEVARPGLPIYTTLATQIEATARVSVGAVVPGFQIADLKDPKTVYSPASFKGKFVLLDFWATWCRPAAGLSSSFKRSRRLATPAGPWWCYP